jgi:hypothetical protein
MRARIFDWLRRAQRSRLSTGRGMAATLLAVYITLEAASASRDSWSAVPGLLVFAFVIWWALWWGFVLASSFWEFLVSGSRPDKRVGRRWQRSGSVRPDLREDGAAEIFVDEGSGILFRKRRWFIASGTPSFEVPDARWRTIASRHHEEPQHLVLFKGRHYWLYRGRFYWINADYSAEDIRALVFARDDRHERQLERAHALFAAESEAPAKGTRRAVPRAVKHVVRERDEGRRVDCGNDFELL